MTVLEVLALLDLLADVVKIFLGVIESLKKK